MKAYIAVIAIAAAATSFSTNAAELLLTSGASKSKESRSIKGTRAESIALDFVSDGDTVGLQFNIPLPKNAKPEQVNIKSCTSEVPATYFSNCSIAKGHIIVQVANDDGTPIPAGLFPIGKISLNGITAKDLGEFSLVAADKNAEAIPTSVRVIK